MRRTLGTLLAAIAAIISLVWFFFLRGGPGAPVHAPAPVTASTWGPGGDRSREPPNPPAPVVETRSNGPTSEAFPIAGSVPEPEPPAEGPCADLEVVYERMQGGGLTERDRACLDERVQADDDTENVLRLLVVEAWNRDEAAWEQRAVQLASITVDPDLHYKLALHFAKRHQPEAALHHAAVAREEAEAWPPSVVGARTRRLDAIWRAICDPAPETAGCAD